MDPQDEEEIHNCLIKLRSNSQRRRRDKVYIGCGVGFGGDRPLDALKLLQRVQELNYLVLECLAERTLADRYQIMMSGGDGWVKSVVSHLLDLSLSPDLDARNQRDKWVNENVKVEIYEVKRIQSLNIVVRNMLDGGVNCSRRIDRHGKAISDLILCQQVVLLP